MLPVQYVRNERVNLETLKHSMDCVLTAFAQSLPDSKRHDRGALVTNNGIRKYHDYLCRGRTFGHPKVLVPDARATLLQSGTMRQAARLPRLRHEGAGVHMTDHSPSVPGTDAGDVTPDAEPARSASGEPGVEFDPLWQVVKRLPAYARVSAAIARDPRVPGRAKALLAAGGAYLVSPIDLVPGIIPLAGQLDDLYVVLSGLRQAIRLAPADVIDTHFRAVGLVPTAVDDDLATIRTFVRQGVAWSIRRGSRALSQLTTQATALARRVRQRGEPPHDQEPQQSRPAPPESRTTH